MQNRDESDPILRALKDEIVNLQRKVSLFEEKLDAIGSKADENHKMLTTLIETMQQLGVVSQPYRKSGGAERTTNDRAYS